MNIVGRALRADLGERLLATTQEGQGADDPWERWAVQHVADEIAEVVARVLELGVDDGTTWLNYRTPPTRSTRGSHEPRHQRPGRWGRCELEGRGGDGSPRSR
jgi:hypothetical protein